MRAFSLHTDQMKIKPTTFFKAISKEKEWNATLEKIGDFDFYHTFGYHILSKKDDERPELLVYEDELMKIAIPLLIRQIPSSTYFDATSVYGYVGPICNGDIKNFDNSNFKNELVSYLNSNNIICVFSRLNPYIPHQSDILRGIGSINELGNIVNIDLTKPLDNQKKEFSRTTKRYIKKLRISCEVYVSKSPKDTEKFIDLYYGNMKRVNADSSYFFERSYFYQLLEQKAFETKVFLVKSKDSEEIISGAMMMYTNKKIVQYHISGTSKKHLNISPIRLILDEVRVRAHKQGYHYFNLGGGLGSKEDSLFGFKSSFSKDFKRFSIWKFIANEEIYSKMAEKQKERPIQNINFFPIYRYETS